MLAIGDELLSGRTKDKNIGYLAEIMTEIGIDLSEVRIVPDDEARIVAAINELRQQYHYVFTSGGIGPTHDDITADAISKAFGVACIYDEKALQMLAENYKSRGLEFTETRKRMARMPQGAVHIDNPVSTAPGFNIGNVYVMAGVPSVFETMLHNVVPTLQTGKKLLSKSVDCPFGEGVIGIPLSQIQENHADTIIGSYPSFKNGSFSTQLVVRGHEQGAIDAAVREIQSMLDDLLAKQVQ
ncbi:competence/damage-inducible protein A [Paenochrobactrum sp. BZR 588]|uniref:competence/damage-inducible protein A n=1 Tax=unclassified Paenochrobactrum TaxID=2639760 RepID=UPI003852C233